MLGKNNKVFNEKLNFYENVTSKIGSMESFEYQPKPSDVQIFNEKLNFRENATSKIGSMENFEYQPKPSDVQIFNDHLPWLRYNKPNLSDEIKKQIEKKEIQAQIKNPFDNQNNKERDSTISNKSTDNSPKLVRKKIKSFAENHSESMNKKSELNLENAYLQKSKTGPTIDSNTKIQKSLINNENRNLKKTTNSKLKIDVATETDDIGRVSVEVQTIVRKKLSDNQPKKLKQAMVNSFTIPETINKDYSNKNPYSKTNEFRYSNSKNRSRSKSNRKDNLITNDLIDTLLPSIVNTTNVNPTKQYSVYTYPNPNSYMKILTDRNVVHNFPNKLAATHVSVDFLDKYWATQRQILINKENYPSRNYSGSQENENLNLKFPHFDFTDEISLNQEIINNKKSNYFANNFNLDSRLSHEKIDKITRQELDKMNI